MNNPIYRVLLNETNFVDVNPNPTIGGSKKDFFRGRNAEFEEHKNKISRELDLVTQYIEGQSGSEIGFLKVCLRESAWAKSYRPIKKLFRREWTPIVGGSGNGEMIFEVLPEPLKLVMEEVASAEIEPGITVRSGREQPNPTRQRCEVGAIDRISLWGKEDKRNFSNQLALDWILDPTNDGCYYVELFHNFYLEPTSHVRSDYRRVMIESFVSGFRELEQSIDAFLIDMPHQESSIMAIKLNKVKKDVGLNILNMSEFENVEISPIEENIDEHVKLLNFLDSHPLVKFIDLPMSIPLISGHSQILSKKKSQKKNSKTKHLNKYPNIGVIDGGISYKFFSQIKYNSKVLCSRKLDALHGANVAGLLVCGSNINNVENYSEINGANLYDVGITPKKKINNKIINLMNICGCEEIIKSIPIFCEYIREQVSFITNKFDVRIFNLSLNLNKNFICYNKYSVFANKIDQISKDYDVIFIISAGNLNQNLRAELPYDESSIKKIYAPTTGDRIAPPAESVYNMTVGALNPKGVSGCIPFAPTRYSRRGPGVGAVMKPDIAHVGGIKPLAKGNTGLKSFDENGNLVYCYGTSFAAPLVAKTAAILVQKISGRVSRETLKCLIYHHSEVPHIMSSKTLKLEARDLVGFGKPPTAKEILTTNDHTITLVFSENIKLGKEINFEFNWPPKLVNLNGSCKGLVKLTLVSTPPLFTNYFEEYIGVDIEAELKQKNTKGGWSKKLKSDFANSIIGDTRSEHTQIKYGLKWNPVKSYQSSLGGGTGYSTDWKLTFKLINRIQNNLLVDGIPFTAILSIKDNNFKKNVHESMKNNLKKSGVSIVDIKNASNFTPRV